MEGNAIVCYYLGYFCGRRRLQKWLIGGDSSFVGVDLERLFPDEISHLAGNFFAWSERGWERGKNNY